MKNLILFLLLSIPYVGCHDDDHICLPECIIDLIGYIGEHHCDEDANISQYRFQNSIVYFIYPGHCADDESFDVLDSNCEVIGRLGGFGGNEKINGLNFFENAEFVDTVWKK